MNWAAWHVSGCERWDEGSDGTEGEIDCPELGSNATSELCQPDAGYFQIQNLLGKMQT